VKRTVLAAFTDALLLPVTAAGAGLVLLNPQRWTGTEQRSEGRNEALGYARELSGEAIFEVGDDDDAPPVPAPDGAKAPADEEQLDRLLSLDVALALIQAARAPLARLDVFGGYPAPHGLRVRDARAELFVLLLQALDGRHLAPGFAEARRRMAAYKVDEGAEVGALVGFFELAHVGDTIASMVDVFFDREIVRPSLFLRMGHALTATQAKHIDRTDFLNAAVREKRRFEGALDDAVAAGLNAGTDVLMAQVRRPPLPACAAALT
jgi:recyclin-1